jgi:hypothetical protein
MTSTIHDTQKAQTAADAVGPQPGAIGMIATIGLTAAVAAGRLWVRHSFAGQAFRRRARPLPKPKTAPTPKFAPYTDIQ